MKKIPTQTLASTLHLHQLNVSERLVKLYWQKVQAFESPAQWIFNRLVYGWLVQSATYYRYETSLRTGILN